MSFVEISEQEDIPWKRTKIFRDLQKCIKFGLITEEEIKQARERREEEDKKNKPDQQRILEGLVTQKEINEAMRRKREKELEKEIPEEEKVLEYLVRGYDMYETRGKIPTLKAKDYREIVDKLIKDKKITEAEVKEYRQKRETQIKERILEELKNGKTQVEIATVIDCTVAITKKYIKKIKKEENISDGDILEWKKEKNMIEGKQIGQEELIEQEITNNDKAIWEYLKQGYSVQEIATRMQMKRGTVNKRRKILIEKGRITKEQIKYAQGQKREKEIQRLKKEIEIEIKFNNKEPSQETKEKIREYMNFCYKIYRQEEIPEIELLFLKKALQKIPIEDKDIIQFVKKCSMRGMYVQALEVVKSRKQLQKIVDSKNKEITLKRIEKILTEACKIQQATELIKKGNTQTEVVCEVTGLSRDEVNILKIKLSTKSVKLLNVYQREGVIKLLLQDKNAKIIQQKYGISDFEMEDMEEQARYRRIPKGKRDIQAQIKQNSIIRIVVLYTKLGKNVEEISEQFNKDIDRIAEKHGKDREEIAPKLKREPKEVEEDIQRALSVGLIKEHELGGIDLLDTKLFQSKELVV